MSEMPARFFIGGLFRNVKEDEVIAYFNKYGRGVHLSVSRDKNGKSLGYGWLHFEVVDAERLLREQHTINDAKITVSRPERTNGSVVPVPPPPTSPQLQTTNSLVFHQNQNGKLKRPREEPRNQLSKEFNRPQQTRSDRNLKGCLRAAELSRKDEEQNNGNISGHIFSRRQYDCLSPSSTIGPPPTFACIPLNICPASFLLDPRVFCCTLDPSQVGKLTIIVKPTNQDHIQHRTAVPYDYPSALTAQPHKYGSHNATDVIDYYDDRTTLNLSPRTSKSSFASISKEMEALSSALELPPQANQTRSALPVNDLCAAAPPPPGPPPKQIASSPPPPQPPQKRTNPPPPGPPPTSANEIRTLSCPPPPGPPPPRFIMPPLLMNNSPPPGSPSNR